MVRIAAIDLADARSRVRVRGAGYDARAPYREAIANLKQGRMLELELDAGESIRTLKLNISRAAKEVDRTVDYGVSDEGTLLVWVQEKPKQKRGPRKARHANTEGEAPTAASADVR